MKRIYFEDKGQDFLWWQINDNGKVIDCGPHQSSVWIGTTVLDHRRISVGSKIGILLKPQIGIRVLDTRTLKYKIKKIENEHL